MRRTAVIFLLLAGLIAVPISASAYEDVGFDPNDRAVVGFDPDIRSTIRRVEGNGHSRVLILVVRAYEDFGLYWRIDVDLDSRAGPDRDRILRLWNEDIAGSGCAIYGRGGHRRLSRGAFRQNGMTVRCRVPIRTVAPVRQIRWRLISPSGYSDPQSETERAPDLGWY